MEIKPENSVFTVVVFGCQLSRTGGYADDIGVSEVERKHFESAAVAKRWARARVTVAGGYHATTVYAGRPTRPLDQHVVSYESKARTRFLECCAQAKNIKEAREMFAAEEV